MLNLRAPMNMQAYLAMILDYMRYSSSITGKEYRDLLRHVTNQDKIRTEKFRQLVPYLQQRNSEPLPHGRQANFEEEYNTFIENISDPDKRDEKSVSNITNIFEKLPEMEDPALKDSSLSDKTPPLTACQREGIPLDITENYHTDNSKLAMKNTILLPTSSPDEISILGTSPEGKSSIHYADLSTAVLPLSLHRRDENLLVTAFVQDLNQIYFGTSETVNKWYALTQQHSQVCYCTVQQFVREPATLQDFVKQKAMSLTVMKDKTAALWLCEPKPVEKVQTPEKATKVAKPAEDTESIFDKIKKTIEGLIAALKEKLDDKKKTLEDKK